MNVTLADLGLLDAPPEPSFDNLTALASQIIGTPVSLVSIVDFEGDRQFFKSQLGLIEPWATERQTPLSHSFCQHVVRNNDALVVDNAPEHALVKDNLAIPDLGVIAYLGVPIYVPGKLPVGALCVIEGEQRTWTEEEVATLKRLADCVSDAIRTSAALRTSERLRVEQRMFTYAFSHDLKTPANSLRLLLREIAEESELSADGRELVEDGTAMAKRMAQQVEDVLAYSRSIDVETEFEPVELSPLLKSILVDLRHDIDQSAAKVDINDLPTINGSEEQLRSLFQNLVGNALKYADKSRTPEIVISAADVGHGYAISVRDNGIGIAPEHQNRIFDLFARLHTRADYPGTGIGLTLCRRVAENHNGSIAVTSSPGNGATFTIAIPKVQA